jgi:hypothetical protein
LLRTVFVAGAANGRYALRPRNSGFQIRIGGRR